MTNEQLWLAVGAPLLFNGLIFILILTNMNARFASMESSVNARFASLESSVNSRFASVENRLASLEQRMDMMIGVIHELVNRLTRVEERMEHR